MKTVSFALLQFKFISLISIFFSFSTQALERVQIFPLEKYNQIPRHFFASDSPDDNKSVFDEPMLKARIENYKEHLFGTLSPWSEEFITAVLNATPPNDLRTSEIDLFESYRTGCGSTSGTSFGENFKPYSCDWFDNTIFKTMMMDKLKLSTRYNKNNRAIATENILSRKLPTNEPIFQNYQLAGEGYPFDLAQESAIWLGTPLYVFGRTEDGLWSLIITNGNFIAWVPSKQIAFVSKSFIEKYSKHVEKYGLRVITHTESKIKKEHSDTVLFKAYIGTVLLRDDTRSTKIKIPIRKDDGFAQFESAMVDENDTEIFPLSPTPKNFVKLFNELVGRPYGWGGMYFYNDCSQELQAIFTTFGIWLPRFSIDQVRAGKIEDLSSFDTKTRLARLANDGKKLTTLVYIQGHIMLYVGNYDYSGTLAPTVYNQMWGLRDAHNSYRSIVGQVAFLPLFESYHYPEDPKLTSFADSQLRSIFKLSFLNEWPEEKPYVFFGGSDQSKKEVDVRVMIFN